VKYDGKFASRWRAKSPDALCAVLPKGKTARSKGIFPSCGRFWFLREHTKTTRQVNPH
jgi:hypothetical protein